MSVPDVSTEVKAVGDAIFRLSIRTLPRVNLPTRPECCLSSLALCVCVCTVCVLPFVAQFLEFSLVVNIFVTQSLEYN